MIGYIFGKIKHIHDPHLLLLTNGVGYEVFCGSPSRRFQIGEEVEMWVHTYVREDQLKLYGFASHGQKELFLTLNGISGVGPKTAYNLVELFPPQELARVVSQGDVKALQTVPGIGRKTAERLMLELESKLAQFSAIPAEASGGTPSDQGVWSDLRQGLSGLGFPDIKVNRVVNLLKRESGSHSLESLMELALRKIDQ